MTPLLLTLLAQLQVTPATRLPDGGVAISVYNYGPAGGAGGGSSVVTVDGGYVYVYGSVTVVQPTGTALHAVVDTAPTTAVTGPLTDTQLRATAVPVSGSVTATVASTTISSGTVTANQGGAPWQMTSQKRAAAALSQAINCANTATALPTTPLTSRVSLCVYNVGDAGVYLGHSSVTTGNGFAFPMGAVYCDDNASQPLYCIAPGANVEMRILEN